MRSYLRKLVLNLSVYQLYSLLGGVPLVVALIFGFFMAQDSYNLAQSGRSLLRMGGIAADAANVVNALQVERGMTAVYVSSQGQKFGPELQEQRARVDTALDALQAHEGAGDISDELEGLLAPIYAIDTELGQVRSGVDAATVNKVQALDFYTGKVNTLLDWFDQIPAETTDPDAQAVLSGLDAFMHAKESAGLERAVVSSSYAAGYFTDSSYKTYWHLVANQDAQFNTFAARYPDGQTILDDLAAQPFNEPLADMRKAVEKKQMTAFASDTFFGVATERIAFMHAKELEMIEAAETVIAAVNTAATRSFIITISSMAALLTIVLAFLISVARAQRFIQRAVADSAQRMIAGDLDVKLPKAGKNGLSRIIISLAIFRDTIKSARDQEAAMRERERADVERMRERSEQAQERTQRIAADLERTAQSTEELASAVASAVENSASANKHAIEMRKKADKGNAVVANAIEAMGRISAASNQITSIIKIIDEIAFQTNLLALNARVEAARAGHVGRGFAVVATEVQQLAARSAKAASDVGGLIRQSGAEIETGVAIVQESGETLTDIAQSAKDIAEVINTLADMSRQQSLAVTEINTATARLDQEMQLLSEVAAA